MAYSVNNDDQYKLVRNILKRVKMRAATKAGLFLYDKYDVPEGETPESVAFRIYGSADYHWIILMTNNVTDRYYQWPMTQPQFEEFLTDKYGAGSEDGIHHYEITQASGRQSGQGAADFSHKVEVNSDEEGAVSVSNRQYEERLQEQYSQIRLLDTRYLVPFIEEFDRLIKQEA